MMRVRLAGLVVAVLTLAVARPAAQKVELADVLRAAASYVTTYSDKLQAVGAEEDYLQLEVSGGAIRVTRRLTSDVVFVGVGRGRVVLYRDVYKQDNNLLRERQPRLLKLFQTPSVLDPLQPAQDMTDEGVKRYVSPNVGLFDEVLAPLALLRTENETKVSFKLDSVKTTGGVQLATLKFTETTTPHVINSPIKEPATGRIVLEVATGIVRETLLVVSNPNMNLRTTVTYALEPGLALWLPSKMSFQSDISSVGAGNQDTKKAGNYNVRESLEGHAAYAKYQQVPVKLNVR